MKHPYLLLVGDKDKIVDNDGIYKWHAKTGTPHSKMKVFDNCYHAIFKEEKHK